MLTCSMMRFLSLFTAGPCVFCVVLAVPVVVLGLFCEVVVVPYVVRAVVAVTVMHVLLFCVACVCAVRVGG